MRQRNRATTYRAYLLRLWREDEAAPWRATLEDVHTGERLTFADLPALCEFITRQATPPPEAHEGELTAAAEIARLDPSLPQDSNSLMEE